MELHIKIVGVLLFLLGLIHAIFPRYFHWKTDLAPLALINREMMVVHTFFVALVVVGIGTICLVETEALLSTPFGKTISLAFAIFWSIRLLVQFFGYSTELWRGKRFETIMHLLFIVLWIYVSGVFWMGYLS